MQYSQPSTHSAVHTLQIDFMDVYYEIHQIETETKKKTKAKRRFEARRGIEEHLEQKKLKAAIADWWEEV